MRGHGSSLWGFPDNILQGWFKMKTTSIFPVHGLASLILMSKYAQSWQFFRGFPDNILQGFSGWFSVVGQHWVLKSVNSVLSPAFANRFQSCFQICVARWVFIVT